jgi:hypothetical protein
MGKVFKKFGGTSSYPGAQSSLNKGSNRFNTTRNETQGGFKKKKAFSKGKFASKPSKSWSPQGGGFNAKGGNSFKKAW